MIEMICILNCLESKPTFKVVLIMKLMPQIKLCVLYRPKYGNITYKIVN